MPAETVTDGLDELAQLKRRGQSARPRRRDHSERHRQQAIRVATAGRSARSVFGGCTEAVYLGPGQDICQLIQHLGSYARPSLHVVRPHALNVHPFQRARTEAQDGGAFDSGEKALGRSGAAGGSWLRSDPAAWTASPFHGSCNFTRALRSGSELAASRQRMWRLPPSREDNGVQ